MPKQILALALCRVSSSEQLENNSLNRQRDAVLKAAKDLGAIIPDDGWWSGSVSSKRGTNVGRKDLQAALDRCKKDQRIKYVIVDEPDRFMRSIDEAAYFEVMFKQLGVTVWYASDPELNKGDLSSKLLKFTKYLSAEGSNEERQNKSIAGQTKALMEGRYPFRPKSGYKRGYERGIPEPHQVTGPALKTILIRVASKLVTPSQGLVELNKSDFRIGRSEIKMDKFRDMLIDPFYAGIVEIDLQIKVRNENGLHIPLITKDQHLALLDIMDRKKKTQTGPRKNGNPQFPVSNMVSCELCADKTNGRYVGYEHSNGKNPKLVYEKYRCRGCNRYLKMAELHPQIEKQFSDHPITEEGLKDLFKALEIVWKEREGQAGQEAHRIEHKLKTLQEAISNDVKAVTNPEFFSIKADILASIDEKKAEVKELESQLSKLDAEAEADQDEFLVFAFDFINTMGSKFLEISQEHRLRCKQIAFPAGFYLDENNKVYTPEISPLLSLATQKKDTEVSYNSLLVRVQGLKPWASSLARKRSIS